MKIDGEKGEGPELMKKFAVPGYPTVILLDKDGNEIDRIVGFGGDKDEYIKTLADYSKGINTFTSLVGQLAEAPNNVDLLYKVARKNLERNEDSTAHGLFTQILNLDPADEKGYQGESQYRTSVYQLRRHDNPAPINAFLDEAKATDYLAPAYSRLARYYAKSEMQDKMFATYERGIQALPDNANFMNGYAWYIFEKEVAGKYTRGVEVAKMAVEAAPKAHYIWDTLAQLENARGNTSAAIEAIEKAIELAPDQASYKKLLKEYQNGNMANQ